MMVKTRDEILRDLAANDAATFVANHIFDRVPHAFADKRADFVSWKRSLSSRLGVDAADLTIVGSAAIGLSLNPNKAFKVFDEKSDIDVAIISGFHFQSAWRFLRQNGKLRSSLTPRERSSWDEHRSNLVYWGTIATDKLLPRFPFGAEWRRAIDASEAEGPLVQRVNVRVYNDYEALTTYQKDSVQKRQRALFAESAGE